MRLIQPGLSWWSCRGREYEYSEVTGSKTGWERPANLSEGQVHCQYNPFTGEIRYRIKEDSQQPRPVGAFPLFSQNKE